MKSVARWSVENHVPVNLLAVPKADVAKMRVVGFSRIFWTACRIYVYTYKALILQ